MKVLLLSLFLVPAAVQAAEPPDLGIDSDRVTVSGISSGAHMATQLHFAYSDLFSGAALLSGGPYNCAGNSLMTAMQMCMTNTEQPLPVAELAAGIRDAAAAGKIADPANLADDRVWLFRGKRDSKISAPVHWAAADLYAEFMPADHIRRVEDVDAEHVFPAKGRGTNCFEIVAPYVGDCDYDAAGELLGFLYPGLEPPAPAVKTELQEVSLPGADDADLMETAYLFVPPACEDGAGDCPLHLVLHGCAQSAEVVGTDFIELSGYLPWAEANGIVLAFPQVAKSMLAPMNPHGCWDWWGYTGDDYAWRSGAQMTVLADWIRSLQD
ncbi:MAG: PHB depolymerase family esterase [Xanthomonadales bacterium]